MSDMVRVSKSNRCPYCQSDHWCLIGRSVIICMRVVSPKVKNFKGGEVGYIHPHPDPNGHRVYEPRPRSKTYHINTKKVLSEWSRAYPRNRLEFLAQHIGVSVASLVSLECQIAGGWPNTWAWPMRDGHGNYIGIRLRNITGNKWAVTGSQAGIFIPNTSWQKRLIIVEGPTDAAAALTLGFFAVGRPSCSGGVEHITTFVRKQRVHEVVVVSDNDDPGIRGAQELQRWLKVPSCILILPTKDLREAVKSGIDKSTIDSMIEQLVWTQPKENNENR